MRRRDFLAGTGALAATVAVPAPRRTPLRSIRTGIHLDNVPQLGLAPLLDVEHRTGHLSIVHWFQAWGEPGTWSQFQPDWLNTVATSKRSGLITWEPWAYRSPDTFWTPATIARGDLDGYIGTWADGFRGAGSGPWWVRPMHEMNGDWYPWGQADPAEYIAAWRHIVALFDDRGVRNVRWVWCPNVDDVGPHPLEAYYPGGRHVDVIGLDGYNWGGAQWRTPAQTFDRAIRRVRALNRSAPLWLAEVGCAPDGGSKAAWVADLYHFARARRVAAVVWFGINKEHDWRIDADPAVAAAVRRG